MKSNLATCQGLYTLLGILCLCPIAGFFSCTDTTDSQPVRPEATPVVEQEAADTTDFTTPKELYEGTLRKLQQLFPPPVLDENFWTLRKAQGSEPYLRFLKNAYPNLGPFQTFREFLAQSSLPSEVYKPVLKKHWGPPDETDIFVADKLVQAFQKARVQVYHGIDEVSAYQQVIRPTVEKDPVFEWVLRRVRDEDAYAAFDAELQQLSRDLENEHIANIQRYLQDFGRDEGLLRLLLREPIVMGQVTYNFTDTEVFLNWLKGEFKEQVINF